MYELQILASGMYVPSRCVTNDDLSRIVDTSDEWIRERTGIAERRFCDPENGESDVSIAIHAAEEALKKSHIDKNDIKLIITATISNDYCTPSVSCKIQEALDLPKNIPVFDINAACSGYCYALSIAHDIMSANGITEGYALVTGAEQLSRLLDMTDRSTCILFGDGAASCVAKIAESGKSDWAVKAPVYDSILGADGKNAIYCSGPKVHPEFIGMDGKEVFKFAVKILPYCINTTFEHTGLGFDDIDWVICHQANGRIIDHVVKAMKAPAEKFYKNLDRFGNTSGASIPLAIAELDKSSKIKPGQLLLLVGFGSGLTWGTCIVRYIGTEGVTS